MSGDATSRQLWTSTIGGGAVLLVPFNKGDLGLSKSDGVALPLS
jgi:hypothetical protein